MAEDRIARIKSRLAGVSGRPWKYNPKHEMFIGTTNALDMYTQVLDLGRDNKEWYPYRDESGTGYRLTEACVKHMAKVKALGEFFEQCREDIAFLLSREDAMRSALERILVKCRDADCGDHCSNSCMFCQAREALSMTNTESQQS